MVNETPKTNAIVEKAKELLDKHATKIAYAGVSVAVISAAYLYGVTKGSLHIDLYLKSASPDIEDQLISRMTSSKK